MSTLSPVTSITPTVLCWGQPDAPMHASASPTSGSTSGGDPIGSLSAGTSASRWPLRPSDWHILIVDDERDMRTLLRLLLQDEGYMIGEAADGMSALAELRASSHPNIVLLDYRMPYMNGEELLEAVMADPHLANRHAFIFVTANLPAFPPALHQLLAVAAIPVVQKPFEIARLLEAIEHAIARLQAAPDLPPP